MDEVLSQAERRIGDLQVIYVIYDLKSTPFLVLRSTASYVTNHTYKTLHWDHLRLKSRYIGYPP